MLVHCVLGPSSQRRLTLYKIARGGTGMCSESMRTDGQAASGSMKNTHGLVTIVIPAYDARPYIQEALDGIANQYYSHWELVVVEDASPESTQDIIAGFAKRFPGKRIHFQRQAENRGASATRNVAMQLARGDYIAFLDADDYWQPNHLSSKVNLLQKAGADIAYGPAEMFDSQSRQKLLWWGPTSLELTHFPESLFARNFIQPSATVMRSDVRDDIGCFDERVYLVEDIEYWLRAQTHGKVFAYDPLTTTGYRKNHASASTTGRLILCYDGLARIGLRYQHLIGQPAFRNYLLSRQLVSAGLGHLSYRPTEHNQCDPAVGYRWLREASQLGRTVWNSPLYVRMARIATVSGTHPLLRKIFRMRFKSITRQEVSYDLCRPISSPQQAAARTIGIAA